jgi:hypothetical protein
MKLTILSILTAILITACGTKVGTTVLTDASGTVYPYAVIVTNASLPGDALVVGFTTQAQADTFAANEAKSPAKLVRVVGPKQ